MPIIPPDLSLESPEPKHLGRESSGDFIGELERPEDFLSPQQRTRAIAAILSEIAWRLAVEAHDLEMHELETHDAESHGDEPYNTESHDSASVAAEREINPDLIY